MPVRVLSDEQYLKLRASCEQMRTTWGEMPTDLMLGYHVNVALPMLLEYLDYMRGYADGKRDAT